MKSGKMIKEERGITLVALVVTIVILLILAGVSLNLVIGNEGMLTRSKEATNKYEKQAENEQQGLDDIEDYLNGNVKPIKVAVNAKASGNGTIDGQKPNTNNPIIPEGYTPINAGNATWGDGNSSPAKSSIDNGLVIKDDNNNEWVWIPVEESVLSAMYANSNEGIVLSGDVGVITKLYTKSTKIGKTGDTTTISRSTPNTTGYREPDLVVGSGGTSYDKNESYYKTILGYDTPKAMAEAFTTDYANMINSIKKYGGFYIGRYELSNEGVQKGKATLTNTNWYNLYKKCTTLNASEKVESKMIWGIQWDLTCDFISKKGEQKNIGNSNLWGNYNNSVGKQKTGYSESWKANNIYDLAGNCLEWTQEAYSIRRVSGSSSGTTSIADNRYRVIRGGFYGSDGSSSPASHRNSYSADISNYGNLRFSSHFNNKVALDPVS